MEISKSQLNYLWTIKQLSGGKVSQKTICEQLNVKKSSASVALASLEEIGYISKIKVKGENRYILDDNGWRVIEEIERERFEFISVFRDLLGMDEEICNKEYEAVYGCFSKEFVEKLTEIHENNYNNGFIRSEWGELHGFSTGIYELPFEVVQLQNYVQTNMPVIPSMGNKGFEHPAKFVIACDEKYIVLKAREIQYVSQSGNRLKGMLQELYYFDNKMKWIRCKKESEDEFVIPFDKILYQRDNLGNLSIGAVKIKAVATTMRMPESAAEITFNFKLAKKM